MLFVQGGSAHRIGLLYIIIQEQKEGIFHKKMFGKRTVWIINQMYNQGYFKKRAFIHFKSWANVRHVSAEGAPKNLKPKPTTAFARKISRGIDKLFDDPKLVAQKFSMLSTKTISNFVCIFFFPDQLMAPLPKLGVYILTWRPLR